MDYQLIKLVHIVSSTVLFGTGVGSAFYMLRANMSKDVPSIYFTARNVVLADWIFTTPTVIIQPLTGIAMVMMSGYSLSDSWLVTSIVLFVIAGLAWLPVVWLQIKMRDLAGEAVGSNSELPSLYWKYERIWLWLGMIAFPAIMCVFYLMVFKSV